jgi:hypothetical protein
MRANEATRVHYVCWRYGSRGRLWRVVDRFLVPASILCRGRIHGNKENAPRDCEIPVLGTLRRGILSGKYPAATPASFSQDSMSGMNG